jgi:hypothetical protein
VVVVNCQAADNPTRTSVTFRDAADGATTILLLQKSLVLLDGTTAATDWDFVTKRVHAVPAAVLPFVERRELLDGEFTPTPLAGCLAISNALMANLMEANPDQVSPHDAKADPRPSGHFADRQPSAE